MVQFCMSRYISYFFIVLFLTTQTINASGLVLHMFSNEKAIQHIKNDTLKKFLIDNFNTLIIGSCYPDLGWAVNDKSLAENSHWMPFVNTYFNYVKHHKSKHSDTYDRLKAHFLGVASHCIQDQFFDQLFMLKINKYGFDNHQDTDRGTDLFAIRDYNRNLNPSDSDPFDDLVNIYAQMPEPVSVSKEKLSLARTMLRTWISSEQLQSTMEYSKFKEKMYWASNHYYEAIGGIESCSEIIAAFWESLWNKLEGLDNDSLFSVIYSCPKQSEIIQSIYSNSLNSGITIAFNQKYDRNTINTSNFIVKDNQGNQVIGGFDFGYGSNVVTFRPLKDLEEYSPYEVTLTTSIKDCFGRNLDKSIQFTFYSSTNGDFYITNKDNKALTIENESCDNGANVHLNNLLNHPNQIWRIVRSNDGIFNIVVKHCNKVMDVDEKTTNIYQFDIHGRCNQRWKFKCEIDGYFSIVSDIDSKRVITQSRDVGNNSNIILGNYTGSNEQLWKISFVSNKSFNIINKNSGMSLSINENDPHDSASVTQSEINLKNNQFWRLIPVEEGYYLIVSKLTNRVLDTKNSNNSTHIYNYHLEGKDNQLWKFVPHSDGYYMVINKLTGKAIDANAGSLQSGVNICQSAIHGGSSQLWKLEPNKNSDQVALNYSFQKFQNQTKTSFSIKQYKTTCQISVKYGNLDQLKIFDLSGILVKDLTNQLKRQHNKNLCDFTQNDLKSGMYVIHAKCNNNIFSEPINIRH